MKRKIRLTEKQLNRVICETVNRILREGQDDEDWYDDEWMYEDDDEEGDEGRYCQAYTWIGYDPSQEGDACFQKSPLEAPVQVIVGCSEAYAILSKSGWSVFRVELPDEEGDEQYYFISQAQKCNGRYLTLHTSVEKQNDFYYLTGNDHDRIIQYVFKNANNLKWSAEVLDF